MVWAVVFALLTLSFWFSEGWLALCAGLALFLFGMQCLEEGLRQLAGGQLERLLALSTATPFKSLMFGVTATMLVQSSSLVSLLTIAFISTGLIQLAAGIAILFGANLGTTSGIWLLALAGQNVSLGPLALPLLVFGVLGSFTGPRGQAIGRVVMGVAFLFLGIDQMKAGLSEVAGDFDPLHYQLPGFAGALLFTGIGLLITVLLQSSHATLMLTLTALGGGQLGLEQGLAIAIGSNMGSTVTAVLGALGGARAGQRLALAHVLFNLTTGAIALILLVPLAALVQSITAPLGLGNNALIQLALFHTLFNAMGVGLFWPWQGWLAERLQRWLPDPVEPKVLITELVRPLERPSSQPDSAALAQASVSHARYLDESALATADSAASAVVQELQHLGRLSLEVICHALYLPVEQLNPEHSDEQLLGARPEPHALDAEQLYQRHIKGVYGDLLGFMGRLEVSLDEAHQQFWVNCQLAALQLVDAVKDAKHLQKNLGRYLRGEDDAARQAYVELRRHVLGILREVRELGRMELPEQAWSERLALLDQQAASFDGRFRQHLFAQVRERQLNGQQASSLMNDLGYASRITQSLRNVLMLGQGDGNELLRPLRKMLAEDGPLIQLS